MAPMEADMDLAEEAGARVLQLCLALLQRPHQLQLPRAQRPQHHRGRAGLGSLGQLHQVPRLHLLLQLPLLPGLLLGGLLGLDALSLHPPLVAFPQPTGLAALPGVLVNLAPPAPLAGVAQAPGDGAAEESLAALAGQHVVVPAGGLVAAHHAHLGTLRHLKYFLHIKYFPDLKYFSSPSPSTQTPQRFGL